MQIIQEIQQLLTSALMELGFENVAPEVTLIGDAKFGDLTTNVAMVLWSHSKGGSDKSQAKFASPRQLAETIIERIMNQEYGIKNGKEYGRRKSVEPILKSISKIEVAGPGFINFTLSEHFLLDQLSQEDGGSSKSKKENEQTNNTSQIIVEYSSPNIAKPFTIGHLRSTIIGDAMANILEYQGHKVYRDNHLGDWGTQFGKQIYAIKYLGDGEEQNLERISKSDQPVKELVKLYVEFHQKAEEDPSLEEEGRAWFKKLEDGDAEARALWQKCIDWSWKEFARIYDLLGIKFTENQGRGFGESYFEDKMQVVIEELEEKGLLTEGDKGAKLVFFKDDKYPPAMILKSNGTTLYHTRDLATDKFRKEKYGDDITVINEVGGEQELYFRQLFEIEQMLGWFAPEQRVHLKHGHFRFKDQKMSTRKGNVIWLADVLEEAKERAREKIQGASVDPSTASAIVAPDSAQDDIASSDSTSSYAKATDDRLAEIIGIGALKWNDLKGSTQREIIFDWDEMLNMQGNSGPYVQYSFARCLSLLRRASIDNKPQATSDKLQNENTILKQSLEILNQIDWQAMRVNINEEEKAVLRYLWQFDFAVERAAAEYAPHHVATYVYELAGRFNSFYNKHSILGGAQAESYGEARQATSDKLQAEDRERTILFRLAITAQVAQTLKSGLGLLGIEAPGKM